MARLSRVVGKMMARIALVIGGQQDSVSGTLRQAHHEVLEFSLAPKLPLKVSACAPDIVVYDCQGNVRLDEAAFSRVRDVVDVPVLVLGPEHSEHFVVRALDLGADGCLCRPYGRAELYARIEACLRRHRRSDTGPGELVIDRASESAVLSGREIKLTPAEYRLLARLVERNGNVVTREDLCGCIWGIGAKDAPAVSLSLCVHHLRQKLERDPHRPRHIMTRWGVGYYLARSIHHLRSS